MIIPRLGYDIRRAAGPVDAGKAERSLPPLSVSVEDEAAGGEDGNPCCEGSRLPADPVAVEVERG
jgi:hypothetical protein